MLKAETIPTTAEQPIQERIAGQERPHIEEFVTEAGRYLSEDTIVLTSVRDADYGIVDVVFVGPEATIGFAFGGSSRARVPYFLDALYEVAALDVAHGLGDILYVAARHHGALFQDDARLRLVPFCSSRILANGRRRGSTTVGRGDDGEPIVVRRRTAVVAEPSFAPFRRPSGVGTAA